MRAVDVVNDHRGSATVEMCLLIVFLMTVICLVIYLFLGSMNQAQVLSQMQIELQNRVSASSEGNKKWNEPIGVVKSDAIASYDCTLLGFLLPRNMTTWKTEYKIKMKRRWHRRRLLLYQQGIKAADELLE